MLIEAVRLADEHGITTEVLLPLSYLLKAELRLGNCDAALALGVRALQVRGGECQTAPT